MTTFAVDAQALNAMDELKAVFRVKTRAQVIRRALALAMVAAYNCERIDDFFVLKLLTAERRELRVLLNG